MSRASSNQKLLAEAFLCSRTHLDKPTEDKREEPRLSLIYHGCDRYNATVYSRPSTPGDCLTAAGSSAAGQWFMRNTAGKAGQDVIDSTFWLKCK